MRREQSAIRWLALILILALGISACGERAATVDTGPEVRLRVGDATYSEPVYSYCWPQNDENVACDVNLAARAQPQQLVAIAPGAPVRFELSDEELAPQAVTVTLLDGPGGQTTLTATASGAEYTAPTQPGQYRVQVDVQYADVNGSDAYVSYVFGLDVAAEAVAAAPSSTPAEATSAAVTEEPTVEPTVVPTEVPTELPTTEPTAAPTETPLPLPSPTSAPTLTPEEEAAQAETEEAPEALPETEVPTDVAEGEEAEPTREAAAAVAQATEEASEEPTDEPQPTETPTIRPSATPRGAEQATEEATISASESELETEQASEEPAEEPTEATTDEVVTEEAARATEEAVMTPTTEAGAGPEETTEPEEATEEPGNLGSVALLGNVRIVEERRTVPLTNAEVTFTYKSAQDRSRNLTRQTTTDASGQFAFEPVELHEDDTLLLTISAPGYATQEIELSGAEAYSLPVINLILLPLAAPTPLPTATPTATPVPVEPTATPTPEAPPTTYPSGAPILTLAYAGRAYEPLGYELCRPGDEGALTDCVQEPTGTAVRRRLSLMRGAAAQLLIAGDDRPSNIHIEYLTDTGVQTGQPEERPGDNTILFTVTPEPGNYILAVRVTWEAQQATYYYRVAVSG